MSPPDELIDTLAATQHGVAARTQLLAAGLTRRMIDLRVSSGRLAPLHAGVYLVRGHPPLLMARLTAACIAAGPGAACSHRGAAALLGLDGVPQAVEISVPDGTPALEGVLVHRVSRLERADVALGPLVPHTGVARTLIDLASILPRPQLAGALDDALSRRLVTCAYVARRLDALGRQGRKGTALLGELLAERTGGHARHESEFERRVFALFAEAGLPLPETQLHVKLPSGRIAILDFAFRPQLLALEADSYRYHSSMRDWAKDHVRNRELIALGWRVLPVTWEDLARPGPFIAAVTRGLDDLPRPA